MFSEEKLSQGGQKTTTKYCYKIFLLKHVLWFTAKLNFLSITVLIKRKISTGPGMLTERF